MRQRQLPRFYCGCKLVVALCLLAGLGVTINAAIAQPPSSGPHEHPAGRGHRHRREPMKKIDLPAPEVTIAVEGDFRVIRANGLPRHQTGDFPTRGNPNAIRPQQHQIKIPLQPKVKSDPTPARPEFGIALNGVIFDAGTAEFWTATNSRTFGGGPGRGGRSAWNYEALGGGVNLGLDHNHAHVQPTGKYHYHGLPTGLLEKLGATDSSPKMVQVGWAFDGFAIYGPWGYDDANNARSELRPLKSSYRLKAGTRPEPPRGPGGKYDGKFGLDWQYVEGLGDLDECNGRTGVTPEFPDGTYYYVITQQFPSVPRMWRGEPDRSSQRRPAHRGRGERRGPGGWPPPRR